MNAAQIIQRTRTLLGDASGIKFSDIQLEAALSSVLAMVNAKVPRVVSLEIVQAVEDHRLTLTYTSPIRDVLRVETILSESARNMPFSYDASQPGIIHLLDDIAESEAFTWHIKLVSDHQLEGLDGAETSTIPTSCEMLLASGTAGQALQMRNTQLAESANQENAHSQILQQLSRGFDCQFRDMLQAWQSAQPTIMPVLSDEQGWQLD
ncbi:MAG: hypothetical protein JEZ00_07710 [Anaerolineaceae bacterium]|nr:hypothetical protein [Anaerolineaceae bacterium]